MAVHGGIMEIMPAFTYEITLVYHVPQCALCFLHSLLLVWISTGTWRDHGVRIAKVPKEPFFEPSLFLKIGRQERDTLFRPSVPPLSPSLRCLRVLPSLCFGVCVYAPLSTLSVARKTQVAHDHSDSNT